MRSDNILGMIPPQAIDVEEAILGAAMLEADAFSTAIEKLRPESFYKPAHETIFRSMSKLFEKGEVIDLVTIVNQLKTDGKLDEVGGAYAISVLTNKVASSANIEVHCAIVKQKEIGRQLINLAGIINNKAYDQTNDVFDLIDMVDAKLVGITEGLRGGGAIMAEEALAEIVRDIEAAHKNDSPITGVPTGMMALDGITGGWQKTDLIILAARPGMGKTALAVECAEGAARLGYPAGFISMEMSTKQLVTRMLAKNSRLTNENLKMGRLIDSDWVLLNSGIQKIEGLPLYIDDDGGLNILELRAKARMMVKKFGVKVLFIDYIQLMVGPGKSREEVVSNISRSLKALAKELEVPIIALSQLSRAVEATADKKPMLSHLRESGSIEQDADVVIFMYRPGYYQIAEYLDGDGRDVSQVEGYTEANFAKNRHGRLGSRELMFLMKYSQFYDYEEYINQLNK